MVNLGNSSYGLYVVVDHGNGWTSLSAHLKAAFVVVGQHVFNGSRFAYNSWLVSRNCFDSPVSGDWNGDRLTDVGVVDPSTATLALRLPDGSNRSVRFGTSTSLPVVGFWNGDTKSDLGAWETTTGTFSRRLRPTKVVDVRYGRVR